MLLTDCKPFLIFICDICMTCSKINQCYKCSTISFSRNRPENSDIKETYYLCCRASRSLNMGVNLGVCSVEPIINPAP